MKPRISRCGYLALFLLLLWGSAEFRHWQLRQRIKELRLASFQVRAIDAATGAALEPWIRMPASDADHLPIIVSGDATPSSRTLSVCSEHPLELAVSAEGFEEQWITLDLAKGGERLVQLKRK